MIEVKPESVRKTLLNLVDKCKDMRQLKQTQTQLTKSPHLSKSDRFFLVTRALFFCALSHNGSLNHATTLFHTIKTPNLHAYNIMIRAYANANAIANANACKPETETILFEPRISRTGFTLYKRMLFSEIKPDGLTLSFLVKECGLNGFLWAGRCVHGHVFKLGFSGDLFVMNNVIGFYLGVEFLRSAEHVFEGMLVRDVVSWNSMVVGFLRNGEFDKAVGFFRRMDVGRNVVTWNSVITGFVKGGRVKEALGFFDEMLSCGDGVFPDEVTVASVLSGCASVGDVELGRWVHGYLRRSGLECDVVIGTALIDMYGKCGCIERAYEVFRGMGNKDVLAWTAMISVYALHGCGKEALNLLEEMDMVGVRPNHVTFVGLISACAHSGLVKEGRYCFEMMRKVYSIEPRVYHYACMVDLLSRAGLFDEAEELIRSMPMEPDVFVWGALLGGCQMHGNVELGERVAQYLVHLQPSNHAFYMNLCDIYAKAGRYDDAKKVRVLMQEKGVKKDIPGCSMIEVDGLVQEFSVNGSPNVLMDEVMWILLGLMNVMRLGGDMLESGE